MRIVLLFVGKTKEKFILNGIDYYLGKLKHYVKTETRIIKPEPIKESSNSALIISQESEKIFKTVKNDGPLILLDREGKQFSSEEFSKLVHKYQKEGNRNIFFAIGGPLGVSEQLKKQAHLVISLSRLTFTHEMARLILLEQLYRAFTILRGEKYHK